MKSKFYTEWGRNTSTTSLFNPKCLTGGISVSPSGINSSTINIKTELLPGGYISVCSNYADQNNFKPFSERFRVFYNKDTYVLVDTEKGLLAKVKRSKDVMDDIEIAVLYLILKGFIHLKTSQINRMIADWMRYYLLIIINNNKFQDKSLKTRLYELANQYDAVEYVKTIYSCCPAVPRSTKRMVKCLIDNAECNRKDAS